MNFFVTYLIGRLLFRIAEFFRHWYLGGLEAVSRYVFSLLETLEQTIALRVTVRYFFQPLYGDWSPVGRGLGLIFRTGRTVLGVIIYPIIFAGGALAYLVWAAIPLYLLINVFLNLEIYG